MNFKLLPCKPTKPWPALSCSSENSLLFSSVGLTPLKFADLNISSSVYFNVFLVENSVNHFRKVILMLTSLSVPKDSIQ